MNSKDIITKLSSLESLKDAEVMSRFFKTGVGEYAQGDVFIGVRKPIIRKIAKEYRDIDLTQLKKVISSPIHEHRMTALMILTEKAKKSNDDQKKQLFDFYIKNTQYINNWDLVDDSCRTIVGGYLINKDKSPLYNFAQSSVVWERRIAIVSTWEFIRYNMLNDTFKISRILLNDNHDLIQKAVGWMLREAGKKDQPRLLDFLNSNASKMPRTQLRYAIEKLPKEQRYYYMSLKS